MSKLKELVPDIKLCKLIPEGEFKDSALVWLFVEGEYFVAPRGAAQDNISMAAPTWEEIMAELPSCVCYRMNEEWSIGLVNDSAENAIKDSSGATAALKLWLKLKGVKYEK